MKVEARITKHFIPVPQTFGYDGRDYDGLSRSRGWAVRWLRFGLVFTWDAR